ncbi:xanthine dehydrogenase family protein molybdopterin-binding subunit [Iningainema tapete]|uniref:Xanthine dehydrogenase family protein molybdopterin-binding subunit n=1 Tax=Iningainema tapete BLCC-T55 TaxID=2748662 RepID=A0A8J7BWZ7_9CYAN|nr:xanthine dehydrogenase family protein molybdopterin-binding subunit [Iningainema tapete]MBD2772742.1 xanthine dehydrogenase family protein molybdopterin-binding subunit [Iningainema tapete BLCC-T55]
MAEISKPIDRVDGFLKVTGQAKYAAEFPVKNVTYGFPVQSTIAAGKIKDIDTSVAEKSAGVLAVITHKNALKLAPRPEPVTPQNRATRSIPILQDTRIYQFGQYIGVVVAETYEQARSAAQLVKVVYETEKPLVDFDENLPKAYKPPIINAGYPTDTQKGDVETALKTADFTLEETYQTPIEHHHPMEAHSTIAVWENGKLTLYDSTQMVENPKQAVANTFQIPKENIRVFAPFIGGGFGSKIAAGAHIILAVMAAQVTQRPVKIVLTRQMMQTNVGLRQINRQKMRLGASKDGKLTAIAHETVTHTSVDEEFVEQSGVMTRMMYDAPNSLVTHRVFPLNVQVPRWTRAPGEAPGSFALESAMDELAYKLQLDPIEFRLKNEPAKNPENGKPWASRSLIEAMKVGAEKFGWSKRKFAPRSNKQGRWLVGYGMAGVSRGAPFRETSARVKLTRKNNDVKAVIEMGATDIGTGSYTIIAQAAAESLGLPIEKIEVVIGDSSLPPTPGSGGSWGAGCFSNAAYAACEKAKTDLQAQIKVNFVKAPTIAELMTAGNINEFQAEVTEKPSAEFAKYAHFSFGANFCEVWVDESLGIVKIPRFLMAAAAGRILNPKTAASQVIGGIVWGIGQALTEESTLDARYGNFTTRTLADYHVPVNLDIGTVETIFINEEDKIVNRLGVKGIGELGITSVAAAIANAVFNATGKRLRDLPLTPDKLI